MLKEFMELYNLDIAEDVKERAVTKRIDDEYQQIGTVKYLPWHKCVKLLYENGALRVRYSTITQEGSKHPLILSGCGKYPFVKVEVRVEDEKDLKIFSIDYPVRRGGFNVSMENMKQSNIEDCIQRAFVKCVAINTGLGLKLWESQESEFEYEESEDRKYNDITEVVKIQAEDNLINGRLLPLAKEKGVKISKKQLSELKSDRKACIEYIKELESMEIEPKKINRKMLRGE